MARFLLARLASLLATIAFIVVSVFSLARLTGDPITTSLGDRLSEAELSRRISAAGYDRPFLEQLWDYLANLAKGDFGNSFLSGLPVSEVVAKYATATLELALVSLVVSVVIALPLVFLAIKKPGGFLDSSIRSAAITIYALPVFLLALGLKLVFSVWLPILPSNGRIGIEYQVKLAGAEGLTGFMLVDSVILGDTPMLLSAAAHLILPAIAIGVLVAANLVRVMRMNLVNALTSEPIEFAKTLGISSRRQIWPHAAKLVAPQVITSFGYSAASVIAGLVYAEVSFEWRGLGWLLTEAVLQRDFVLIQAIVILLGVLIVFVNALVDVAIFAIDRRGRRYGMETHARF